MSIKPGVLDANVLVYSIDATAVQHLAAMALVDSARAASVTLYVTSQILCEFYSIITNPRRVAAPLSAADALSVLSLLLTFPGLHLLPLPVSAVAGWMTLLQRRPVLGANIYDLQIVATMQANGIQRIYTFNTTDFTAFSELVVVNPQARGISL